MKDFMKNGNGSTYENFKPIVIVMHPYNKFKNVKQYSLYKAIKSTNEVTLILSTQLKDELITNEMLTKVGYTSYAKRDWNIQKEGLDIKLLIDKPDGTCEIFTILQNVDYNYVFECEAGGKQFGKKDDYWTIRNRDKLELSENVELKKNLFITKILNKNSVIKVNVNSIDKYYIVTDRNIIIDLTDIIFTFTMYEIKKGEDNNLLNCTLLSNSSVTMAIKINKELVKDYIDTNRDEIENILYDKNDELIGEGFNKREKLLEFIDQTFNGSVNNFIKEFFDNTSINYYTLASTGDELTNSLKQIAHKLFFKYLDIKDTKLYIARNKISSIYKINTLMIEEVKFNLKDAAKNALVYASVLLYPAQSSITADRSPNYMYYDKFHTLGEISDIPITSTIEEATNFNKLKSLRKKVDYRTMPNQIYINNDQVQNFNSTFESLKVTVLTIHNMYLEYLV
jgi:hypothetical protein